MTAFKRSQAKYVRKSFKTTNWPEYEAGLRQRGSLTVWIAGQPADAERTRASQAQPLPPTAVPLDAGHDQAIVADRPAIGSCRSKGECADEYANTG